MLYPDVAIASVGSAIIDAIISINGARMLVFCVKERFKPISMGLLDWPEG